MEIFISRFNWYSLSYECDYNQMIDTYINKWRNYNDFLILN